MKTALKEMLDKKIKESGLVRDVAMEENLEWLLAWGFIQNEADIDQFIEEQKRKKGIA